MLSNALDDWNKFYNECEDAWTPEELAQYESRASTCLSTFRAIFAEYPEFDTDEQVTMTLHEISRSGTSVHDKTAHLVEMAGDVLQSFLQDDGTFVHYGEANDTGDLWKALDSLITAGPDPDKQSPWPLVKQVSIGVRGPRVLDFYVLVDMPGVSDTNEVRVDATQQFLKQCDYLVIVARAGRMTTDPVVRSILQKYGKALEGSVMIVGMFNNTNYNREAGTKPGLSPADISTGFLFPSHLLTPAFVLQVPSQTRMLDMQKQFILRGCASISVTITT